MIFFKDYTCPSSQLNYLIIGTEGSMVETRFLVQDSFVGRYVDPWPQLRNTLHMRSWTSEYDHTSNKASKVWYLEKPNPQRTNIESTFSNLDRRMILEELRWGDNVVLEGEYHCIPGYWEWIEDVLSKTGQSLNNACISDVDLHILGGFPISGVPYEEVIPNSTELTSLDDKRERFLPRTCECMFAAFHHLKEKNNGNIRVSFNEWIQFWCKKDLKYELAPPRKENKSRCLSSTHNPTGEIPTEINTWSSTQEMTHYQFTSGPSLPRMVVYSGEGAAKYFDKDEARKRVHRGEIIVWNEIMLSRPYPTYYTDDGKVPELDRQFGFHQDIPGNLENDIHAELLDEGLRYCHICISHATISKATIPPAVTSAKKHYTTQYSSWWERSYGMVLEHNLYVMVEKVGSEFVTLLEDKSQDIKKILSKVKTPLAPQHQSKKINSSKKQRVEPSGAEVVDLRVIEVQSVDSPSRSMTIQSDKVNAARHPLELSHEMPQTLSTSRGQTLKGLTPNSNELSQVLSKSNGAISVFDGKGVVFNHKRMYILGLWEEICGKLSKTSLDNISSYKDYICEIFKEMSEMNLLDLSPLKSLAHEDKKMELIFNDKEHLELFRVEEGEKAKQVSSNKKSLKKVKRKLATLQGEREGLEAVLKDAKKKVEEIQAKILATEDEISSYEHMSLLTLEDSIHLEQKRECLEASRQDLTNYKLCLD
ncbi:hypothetical protein H5410_045869 [Solanum commersonii]|uniref:Aminotransferase-like plant mobile domain-containing protein n=1 Tax=Solanum commersonii TaxID=4109 RepID=A0A9J5XAR1_SOLCO|nr:hypothetical protein H5410_045869 [Solanum commersonii]